MASSFHLIAICSLLFISATFAQTQFKPKALLLQVTKDPKTLQYLTSIKQRTPLVSLSLTVDLGGKYLWTDCESGYISSTYRYYACHTPQCKSTTLKTFCDTCDHPAGPGCHNDSCTDFSLNSVGRIATAGDLTSDVISIESTDGKNPTRVVSVPQFYFFCTKTFLLEGLANGVKGIAGLGRTATALPSQLARFFNYRKIFAICLSPSSKGVVFLGDGPYVFLPNINVASSLTYTPLIVNRGEWIEQPSSEYFIGVKSIKINGQALPINTTLLSFDAQGNGGTKISTVNPYTLLEESIYAAVVKAFAEAMSNVTRVAPVSPFGVCYSSKSIGSTRVGPAVPTIDLVLQSDDVYWRIFGANSMVQVSKEIMCLGFVSVKQADILPWNAIVIGGYQLENNLLQFNVAKSMLGFSSSLLFRQTTCANFNFTSTV